MWQLYPSTAAAAVGCVPRFGLPSLLHSAQEPPLSDLLIQNRTMKRGTTSRLHPPHSLEQMNVGAPRFLSIFFLQFRRRQDLFFNAHFQISNFAPPPDERVCPAQVPCVLVASLHADPRLREMNLHLFVS